MGFGARGTAMAQRRGAPAEGTCLEPGHSRLEAGLGGGAALLVGQLGLRRERHVQQHLRASKRHRSRVCAFGEGSCRSRGFELSGFPEGASPAYSAIRRSGTCAGNRCVIVKKRAQGVEWLEGRAHILYLHSSTALSKPGAGRGASAKVCTRNATGCKV